MNRRHRGGDDEATLVERVGEDDPTLVEAVPSVPSGTDADPETGTAATLVQAAAPLLVRLTRLTNTLDHPDPAALKTRFQQDLADFRRRTTPSDPVAREQAAQLLALTVDDLLLHETAWAEAWRQQGLLSGPQSDGQPRLQSLLEPCLDDPRGHQALLELAQVCLALGLQGEDRTHPDRVQALRERVHRALAAPPPDALLPEALSQHGDARRLRAVRTLLPLIGAVLVMVLLGGLAVDLAVRQRGFPTESTGAAGPAWAALLLAAGATVIALVLLGRGLQAALGRWWARRRGRQLLAELHRRCHEAGDPEPAAALEALGQRLGPDALVRLPWYRVMGEPGSGRSSALAAIAEDHGRLVASADRRGGGQWLLTDRAILIEDQGEGGLHGRALLDLLKRQGNPLAGVLLVVAADRLPLAGRPLPRTLVESLEGRLRTLQQQQARPLAVHLLVTRLDRVPGFREFFGPLEHRRRNRVWGVATRDCRQGLQQLQGRLWRQLPQALWQEPHPRRRQQLFAFPAQFATLETPLVRLTQALLPGGPAGARLEGIYYASALQQGPVEDRLADDHRDIQTPVLPHQARRYFLAGLPAALADRRPRPQAHSPPLWRTVALLGLATTAGLIGYGWQRLQPERVAETPATAAINPEEVPAAGKPQPPLQQPVEITATVRRVYGHLRQACLEEVLNDFEPATLDPAGVFTSPRTRLSARRERIPGCFTREGLLAHLPDRAAVEAALQDQDGRAMDAAGTSSLLEAVRRAYLEDYVSHWQDLLNHLELTQLTAFDSADFDQSLQDLRRLADARVSPLALLLEAVDEHVHLEPSSTRRVDDDPSALVTRHLERAFGSLHWAARGDNLDTLLERLKGLADRLEAVAPATDDAPDPAAREAARAAIDDLQRFANYQPQPLKRWLRDLADDSTDLMTRDEVSRLNQLLNEFWLDDVLRPCRQGIEGHYPLAARGGPEASLEGFGAFFGPTGTLATFFDRYLAEFVATDKDPWQWREESDYGRPAVSPASLALFQRGAAITKALFATAEDRPHTLFELETDAGSDRVMLELDGQRVGFEPGLTRPYPLQWPGGGAGGVVLSDIDGDGGIVARWPGAWGWPALLQGAGLEPVAGSWPYRVVLGEGEQTVTFRLRPDADHDPFALMMAGTLKGFDCPGRL